jgi:hypothetical protein
MMSWKGCGRKRSWPNFKALSRHLSTGTEEKTENLSQGSRSTFRDLNPGPPECDAGVLTTRQVRSVIDGNRPNKCVKYPLFKKWNRSHCLLRVRWMRNFKYFFQSVYETHQSRISSVLYCTVLYCKFLWISFLTLLNILAESCCLLLVEASEVPLIIPRFLVQSCSSQSEAEFFFLFFFSYLTLLLHFTRRRYIKRTAVWQGQSEVILLEWVKGVEDC